MSGGKNRGASMRDANKIAKAFCCVALLVACSGNSTEVEVLYRSDHCGAAEKGLYQVTSQQELNTIARNRMNPLEDSGNLVPAVNFSENHLLLITWGTKPNPGYRIELTSPKAVRDGDTLRLPVVFQEPDLGSFYPQVMTSPCIILSLPKGDYSAIEAGGLTASLNAERGSS